MAYTTINKSTDYFNTKLYTGNGSTNAITGVGFQPDMVWLKERSSTSNHQLGDAVRGATKYIQPNITDAESTDSNRFSSFDSDGFTQGANNGVNENGQTYASWNWKANGAGSANTDGSISSTVSANTTAGFSIVSWTGTGANATIGHGLGSVPKMILLKCRTQGDKWIVYNSTIGNTKYLVLNDTDAETTSSTHWNNTTPTNTVFSTGTSGNVSGVGETFIAYCFAEKKGFSKFGSYTGNGSTDGSFIYTGFKPAFLMIKNSSTGSTDWTICDSKRDGFNANNHRLFANTSGAESTSNPWEMYSNGFKMTTTGSFVNTSGDNFIYMAFAEAPLVGSNNIPCTAR